MSPLIVRITTITTCIHIRYIGLCIKIWTNVLESNQNWKKWGVLSYGFFFFFFPSKSCSIGMVLPLWSDTKIHLDGDGWVLILGAPCWMHRKQNCSIWTTDLPQLAFVCSRSGFTVSTAGRTHVFKPVSVQAMWWVISKFLWNLLSWHAAIKTSNALVWCVYFIWNTFHLQLWPQCRSALQVLHKVCEVSRRYNYFPGGMALTWMGYYESCITSDQSCINEWNAMKDLETTRPDSPPMFVDKSVHIKRLDVYSLRRGWHKPLLHFPLLKYLNSCYWVSSEVFMSVIFGRPSERERTECLIKAKLRSIMTCQDLENVTCKQVKYSYTRTFFFVCGLIWKKINKPFFADF